MPTLTVLWPERKNTMKIVHLPAGNLDFEKNYKHQNRIEYAADFDPPFLYKSEQISIVFFESFKVKEGKIKFKDLKKKFDITVNTKMTIRNISKTIPNPYNLEF